MRTTQGFRQEEFIQNGEMKVTLKDENADYSKAWTLWEDTPNYRYWYGVVDNSFCVGDIFLDPALQSFVLPGWWKVLGWSSGF